MIEPVARTNTDASIAYLDGPRLARALRAGIARLLADQERLNKINVYPVPDGDTGTNLALTVQAVLAVVSGEVPQHIGRLLIRVADAALDGARGNSGAILAQCLQGMADHAEKLPRLEAAAFSEAMQAGATYAREAMSEPVEGTILTVLDAFAAAINETHDSGATDLAVLFDTALERSRVALAKTTSQLDALRKAGVVDAGAAGLVDLLEGIAALMHDGADGDPAALTAALEDLAPEMAAGEAIDLRYRYCTECLVTGSAISRRKLREDVTELGNSLVLAGSHAKMRVHIHTNEPERVFERARRHGTVSGEKADDMSRQQDLAHAEHRSVVITTDTAGDVPDDELERLNIYMTPVRVHFGSKSYLDKVTISAEELYHRLRTEPEAATTSQPAPGDFRRQFEYLKSHYRDVVSIHVTSRASGTWQAAKNVADSLEGGERIHVVDSLTASLGQGLLVIDAAEAAQAGYDGDAVVARIGKMMPLTQTYCVLRELEYGVRGGRVNKRVKTIADLLRLTPVLGLRDGLVKPAGVIFSRRDVIPKFARFLLKRIDPEKTYRVAIGHADCEPDAVLLRELIEAAVPNRHQLIFTRIGTALGVHAGPSALVVSFQEYVPPSIPGQ